MAEDRHDDRLRFARDLSSRADRLTRAGRHAEVVHVYDELLARFDGAPEPDVRAEVACALVGKGVTLDDLGRWRDALPLFDEVVTRFSHEEGVLFREQVARALGNKAFCLAERGGDPRAALEIYDELLRRFRDVPEPELREQVLFALHGRADALHELSRFSESLATCEELLRSFSEADVASENLVARALLLKGIDLADLGRIANATAVFDEVVERFAHAADPQSQVRAAKALRFKSATYWDRDRAAALAALDDAVELFSTASDPELRREIAWALNNKGSALDEAGERDAAIATYDRMLDWVGTDDDPRIGAAIEIVRARRDWLRWHRDAPRRTEGLGALLVGIASFALLALVLEWATARLADLLWSRVRPRS